MVNSAKDSNMTVQTTRPKLDEEKSKFKRWGKLRNLILKGLNEVKELILQVSRKEIQKDRKFYLESRIYDFKETIPMTRPHDTAMKEVTGVKY